MKKIVLSAIAFSLLTNVNIAKADHHIMNMPADSYSTSQIFDLYKNYNVLYKKNEGYKYFEAYGQWYVDFAKANKMDDALTLNLSKLSERFNLIKSNARYDFIMNGHTKANRSVRLNKFDENMKIFEESINSLMTVNNMFLNEDIDFDKEYALLYNVKTNTKKVIDYTQGIINVYADFSVGYMKELNVISNIIFEHAESMSDTTLNKILERGDNINPQPKYINQLNF